MAKLVDFEGKNYSFPDDATDDEITSTLEQATKPAAAMDVLKAVPEAVQLSNAKQLEGQRQFAEDVGGQLGIMGVPVRLGAQLLRGRSQENVRQAEAAAKEATPDNMSTVQKGLLSGGASVISNTVPALTGVGLAAAATRAGVPLAQGGMAAAEAALSSMSLGQGAQEYGEQRQAGMSPGRAGVHAAVTTAAEYLPEKWGMTKLIDAIGGKSQVGKAALGFMLRDLGGEELTTAVEWLNGKLSREPNTTLGDLWQQMKETAVATAVSAPVQGGAMRVGGAVAEAAAKKPEQVMAPQPGEQPQEVPQPTQPTIDEVRQTAEEALAKRRGAVINDSELPLIGLPEGNQTSSPELPIDQQLELLRKSYADMENSKSFQDTAEDRIARRQDFVQRRAQLEQALMLHPEGRMFLTAADEAMGVSRPNVDVNLETEVNDYAILSPEQAQQREAARENRRQERWAGTPLEAVPMTAEDGTPIRDSNGRPMSIAQGLGVTGNAEPHSGDLDYGDYHENAMRGTSILRANRPELVGQTWDTVAASLSPSDLVYFGNPGAENSKNAADMMAVLQSLKDKFLPNAALIVAREPTDNESFHSAAWKVTGKPAFVMHLPSESWTETDAQQRNVGGVGLGDALSSPITRAMASNLDTLTHEFTHIMHMAHWQSSTPEEKAAVAKEYHEDLKFAYRSSLRDAFGRLFSPKTAERMIARAERRGLDVDNPAKGLSNPLTLKVMFPKQDEEGNLLNGTEYWFNFNEWMAHKGVKYFQTRAGVTRENVPFFRRWLQKMTQFYKSYVAQFAAPSKGFAQWMDNIAMRESRGLGFATEQDVVDAQAKLIAAGVDPALAQLVSTVRADNKQVLNNAAFALKERKMTQEAAEAYENYLGSVGMVFFDGTSRSNFEKGLPMDLAQALLNDPRFNNAQFNSAEFADSLFYNVLKAGTLEISRGNGGNSFLMVATSPTDKKSLAAYRTADGKLRIDASDYTGSEAQATMSLALATQSMRVLAQQGVEHVDISELPMSVQKALAAGQKGVDAKHFEIPYWAYEEPATPVETPPQSFHMPRSVVSVGAKLGIPWLSSAGNQVGRFNWLMGKALGAYELISLNEAVPGMVQERDALRNRMMYRHQWLAPANDRVQEWAYGVGKTEAAKLGRILFDEAESETWSSTRQADPNNPGQYVFTLDPKLVQSKNLDIKTQELYSKVRNDFYTFAEEWNKVALWEFARGELSDVTQNSIHRLMQEPGNLNQVQQIVDMEIQAITDPVKMQRLTGIAKDINDEFRAWRDTPYMPYTRFGRYGSLVRDGQTGKTLYFAGHDSVAEARQHAKDISSQFPGAAVSVTYLEDSVFELAGLPPSILQAMKTKLQLDPQQQEVFGKVLQQLSLANSFRHRAAEKRGIAGYSQDALRAYSDYFRRGSAFMARVKSNPELADAQTLLQKHIQNVEAQVGPQETVKLHQLHEWFGKFHEYLNGAGNDYGQLKSIVAMFHFVGNFSSALMNLTQVPLVTLPWLSERYGMQESLKELTNAYKDAVTVRMGKRQLSADEQALYEHALKSGFLNESQATIIGQMADGAALTRATLTGWGQRTLGAVNHYGMWMFSTAEFQNRMSTMLAAYRLARSPRFRGAFDEAAYNFARQAVEDTQNEYAQENRPEIMRGKGGIVLQFMHYTTHMLFMQLGGDKAWWRLLIAQLAAGGLLGLPFAEDLTNAAKFLTRKVGVNVEPELLLREFLADVGLNQDLVARGLFSDVFGFDLSKRVSLGEVLPGMRAIGSNRKLDEVLYDAVADVGGPGASLVMNAMKFIAQDDKLAWDNMRRIMPTEVKNIGNAVKAFREGEVKDGTGAKVFEPDLWDLTGMIAGFSPEELTKHYLKGTLQSEQAAYWTNRKQALLQVWDHIVFDRNQDREAQADFMKRLREYNEQAPGKMKLTGDQLRQSVIGKQKARVMKEQGFGSNPSLRQSAAEISQTLER